MSRIKAGLRMGLEPALWAQTRAGFQGLHDRRTAAPPFLVLFCPRCLLPCACCLPAAAFDVTPTYGIHIV